MRVLVTGASGLVGTALVEALTTRGDDVAVLVRSSNDQRKQRALRLEEIADFMPEAVIHLAGESIMGRWDDEKRRRIRESRELYTTQIVDSLSELPAEDRPKVFVSASAVGYYGSRGNELLHERVPRGEGFLAEVVDAWETAASRLETAGVRVVYMRTGAVQAKHAGALYEQIRIFRFGIGGKIGNGQAWMSWVSLTDLVNMYLFAIDDQRVEGVVNAVGPTPVTNASYTRALGRAIHRPTVLTIPPIALTLRYGDMAKELLLASQKVVPAKLEALGYEFLDRTIEDAFRRELR